MNFPIDRLTDYLVLTVLFQIHLVLGLLIFGAKWNRQTNSPKKESLINLIDAVEKNVDFQLQKTREK